MELQFFLQEMKNLTKIYFTKTNGSNAKIKYFIFSLSMIIKTLKETLNKHAFQRRKNEENSLVSRRYQTIENTTNKWLRMMAMTN